MFRRFVSIAAVVVSAVLTGCSATGGGVVLHDDSEFEPSFKAKSVLVIWKVEADPKAACEKMGVSPKWYYDDMACAGWSLSGGSCIIITGKKTTMPILGHEARHCFDGQFHD